MNQNGLIVYRESFVSRLRNFFRSFFGRRRVQQKYMRRETIYGTQLEADNIQNNYWNDSKTNNKSTEYERKNFLKEIEENNGALNMLSTSILRKLEKYYESVIERNNKKIKKLTKI
ncbi:MAG: hypothetical protein IKD77_01020 [Bacilli bacterium]|nr:hypothetical protein [Bacilli bacterium]